MHAPTRTDSATGWQALPLTPGDNGSTTAGTPLRGHPVRVAMMATRRHLLFRRTAFATAATVLVLLSGCSSSEPDADSSSDAGGGSAAREVAGPAPADADAGGGTIEAAADTSADTGPGVEAQKVISTGNVQLRSDDVGQAIFDVRKVVDVHGGTVSEDDTETDDDGGALRSRMVLRIPTADFDDAMTELCLLYTSDAADE